MKYLKWFDWLILAAAAVMSINLGVVVLMYAIYIEEAPRYREEFGPLISTELCFLVITAIAGLAGWGLHKQRSWHWLFQALMFAGLGLFVFYYLPEVLSVTL